jgi:hypothetical protein
MYKDVIKSGMEIQNRALQHLMKAVLLPSLDNTPSEILESCLSEFETVPESIKTLSGGQIAIGVANTLDIERTEVVDVQLPNNAEELNWPFEQLNHAKTHALVTGTLGLLLPCF